MRATIALRDCTVSAEMQTAASLALRPARVEIVPHSERLVGRANHVEPVLCLIAILAFAQRQRTFGNEGNRKKKIR